MNHMVDSLLNMGFSKENVRRHRTFVRAAIVARNVNAKVTLVVSPPNEEDDSFGGDRFLVNVYAVGPKEIGDELPTAKEIMEMRPKRFFELTEIISDFLKK
jgi:hypothetical protein